MTKKIEGSFSTVADNSVLALFYNGKEIFRIHVPQYGQLAENSSDSEVNYSEEFFDLDENEYIFDVISGMYGISYIIEATQIKNKQSSSDFLNNVKVELLSNLNEDHNLGEYFKKVALDEFISSVNNVEKNRNKKSPNWDKVELILTLSFYFNVFPNLPNSEDDENFQELYKSIKYYHQLFDSLEKVRTFDSIRLKLSNFEFLDNNSKRVGLKNASKLDKKIWNDYSNNKKLLNSIALKIKDAIADKDKLLLQSVLDDTFTFDDYSIAMGKSYSAVDKFKKPVLNIKSVSKVFSKYIIKYNVEYTSTIIGIFAKWGRGKTFFYEELKKDIRQENKNIYFCKFQPWKYQKQESAWAYLYEKVLKNYLKNKNTPIIEKISSFENRLREKFNKKSILYNIVNGIFDYIEPIKFYKIFLLNKTRLGMGKLISSLISLLFLFIWIFMPIDWKFNTISWIIGVLGFTGTILLYKSYSFYMKSKGIVSDLVVHYGKIKDYSNHLGFQNEIEKELKYLINTYITEEDERLILFIDDLDRCDEKMIINIMDSLRLVLEDKDINKKLTIITAIDERILLKSINHKYFTKDNHSLESNISSKEYIEKFFLIALKLNHLNDKDKIELVDEYTTVFNDPFKQSKSMAINTTEKINIEEELKISQKNPVDFIENNNLDTLSEDKKVNNTNLSEELEVINIDEINFIKKCILEYNIDTPRKINMMIQRYLLFKNFIFEELGYENSDYRLYISLIFYITKEDKLKKLIDLYNNSQDKELEFKINDENFKLEKNKYIVLVKYAEMVTPF